MPLKNFHQRLTAIGETDKQALTAVMRKMIVLINTLRDKTGSGSRSPHEKNTVA